MTVAQGSPVIASITGENLLSRMDNISGQLGEVKQAVAGVSPALAEHQRMIDSHSTAIRSLEQKWAFLAGMGAVVSMLLGGGVAAAIITAIHH